MVCLRLLVKDVVDYAVARDCEKLEDADEALRPT